MSLQELVLRVKILVHEMGHHVAEAGILSLNKVQDATPLWIRKIPEGGYRACSKAHMADIYKGKNALVVTMGGPLAATTYARMMFDKKTQAEVLEWVDGLSIHEFFVHALKESNTSMTDATQILAADIPPNDDLAFKEAMAMFGRFGTTCHNHVPFLNQLFDCLQEHGSVQYSPEELIAFYEKGIEFEVRPL